MIKSDIFFFFLLQFHPVQNIKVIPTLTVQQHCVLNVLMRIKGEKNKYICFNMGKLFWEICYIFFKCAFVSDPKLLTLVAFSHNGVPIQCTTLVRSRFLASSNNTDTKSEFPCIQFLANFIDMQHSGQIGQKLYDLSIF